MLRSLFALSRRARRRGLIAMKIKRVDDRFRVADRLAGDSRDLHFRRPRALQPRDRRAAEVVEGEADDAGSLAGLAPRGREPSEASGLSPPETTMKTDIRGAASSKALSGASAGIVARTPGNCDTNQAKRSVSPPTARRAARAASCEATKGGRRLAIKTGTKSPSAPLDRNAAAPYRSRVELASLSRPHIPSVFLHRAGVSGALSQWAPKAITILPAMSISILEAGSPAAVRSLRGARNDRLAKNRR